MIVFGFNWTFPIIITLIINVFSLCQPHDFVEQLMSYKNSLDESDLREKQLAALRVDVCSTEALKRLKGNVILTKNSTA